MWPTYVFEQYNPNGKRATYTSQYTNFRLKFQLCYTGVGGSNELHVCTH